MEMTPIDSGFFRISDADAKRLNGGRFPQTGHEALVEHDGKYWWLAKTVVYDGPEFRRLQVWSIREARGWKLENGQAVCVPIPI